MNRVRRTLRQKSPSPDPVGDTGGASYGAKRPGYSMMSGGSPILTRTSTGGAAGNLAAAMGAFRAQQSLLQKVIRDLVDSEDDHERKMLRMNLESDLEVTSERLDALVKEHRDKLHGTLSTFDAVDKKVRDSQQKVQQIRANLRSCKSLLRCKREELKRLWLEDVKYKHMLQMIEAIEEVRSVPEKLANFKANKRYLQATELLKNSVARLDGELASVEALKELKQELLLHQENLHEELIEELHRHLYVKAVLHKPEQRLMRNRPEVQFLQNSTKKSGSTLTRATQSPRSQLEASGLDDDILSDDMGGADLEKDSGHYMAVLVEALSILGRVQDAIDAVQQRMKMEFLLIIEKAAIQVSRTRDEEEGHLRKGRHYVKENQPKQLTKMLQLCFEQFRAVVHAHSVLLGHFQHTKEMYKAPYSLYNISDVWIVIQQVVQAVLEVYLAYDDENAAGEAISGYTAFTNPGDAHSMFSRRKAPSTRVTKKPLFRFDSSRHAISISSYMREQRDQELAMGRGDTEQLATRHYEQNQPSISQHLVCQPHNRNITVAFKVVKDFVEEIEEALVLETQDHCQLHYFLHEYIERDFLERVHVEYFKRMGNCAKPEAAKATAPDQKTLKVTGSKLCVLNSVLTVWQLVVELRQLMKDLPLYSAHFLGIICELLVGYMESVQLLYKGLTSFTVDTAMSGRGGTMGGAGYGQEGVVSSKWASDEVFTRIIKGLATWFKVKEGKGGAEDERFNTVYNKESELLMQRLQEPLRQHNVILNHENLRLMAIMHESLDWFSGRLKQMVFDLSGDSTDGASMSSPALQDHVASTDYLELAEQFSSVQQHFQSLAEMAIIMLHLEVRCHCFYYLLPAIQKSNYMLGPESVDRDEAVQSLSTDLKNIDLVMVAVLSQEKYRYLFEGVGHLVAAIFISSTYYIKAINSNGIKKICSNILLLQSCLSKITLIRERELDKARKYFEMLYLSFDEIMEGILEHGPVYSQEDYARALTLLAHSETKAETPAEREKHLEQQLMQLEKIFSGDTV